MIAVADTLQLLTNTKKPAKMAVSSICFAFYCLLMYFLGLHCHAPGILPTSYLVSHELGPKLAIEEVEVAWDFQNFDLSTLC